jgi:hypothetical protein
MLSCQQTQSVIDGKKRIILNPSESQKREFEAVTFAEGEVYGIDILVSTGEDGKVRCSDLNFLHFFIFFRPLGTPGRVPYNDLPTGFYGHLPVENEKFAHRFLGSAKESRIVPFQYSRAGG